MALAHQALILDASSSAAERAMRARRAGDAAVSPMDERAAAPLPGAGRRDHLGHPSAAWRRCRARSCWSLRAAAAPPRAWSRCALLARAAAETGRSRGPGRRCLDAGPGRRGRHRRLRIGRRRDLADAIARGADDADPRPDPRRPRRRRPRAPGRPSRPPATDGLDETVAVHLPPPAPARRRTRRGACRRPRLPRWPWLVALLVVALAAGAALLPGATVRITPGDGCRSRRSARSRSPSTSPGTSTGDLQATKPGTATGQRLEKVPGNRAS